jgi:hypothetical protein
MDANILAVITTVLGLAFALPGAVLRPIRPADEIYNAKLLV